jgi:hypothetical protein
MKDMGYLQVVSLVGFRRVAVGRLPRRAAGTTGFRLKSLGASPPNIGVRVALKMN